MRCEICVEVRFPVHCPLADVRAERAGAFMKFARQRLRRCFKAKSGEVARGILARIEPVLIFDNEQRCVLHAPPFRAFPGKQANTESQMRQTQAPKRANSRAARARRQRKETGGYTVQLGAARRVNADQIGIVDRGKVATPRRNHVRCL